MMSNHNIMRLLSLSFYCKMILPLDRFVWGGSVKVFKLYKQGLAVFLILMLIVTNVTWAQQKQYPVWDNCYTGTLYLKYP